MTTQASPSPPQGPTLPIDEAKLPSGQCRYILLNPEIKGHRCACVGFTLNRTLPSVSCECGHLSCYHIKEAEKPTEKTQLEKLLLRVQLLEAQLDREHEGGLGSAMGGIVTRLGDLEEQVEKSREEIGQETRAIYGQINRVWQSVDQVSKRQVEAENRYYAHDERLIQHDKTLVSLDNRVKECDDNTIDLEDRLDCLEEQDIPYRPRQQSSPMSDVSKNGNSPTIRQSPPAWHDWAVAPGSTPRSDRERAISMGSTSSDPAMVPWTVHISLLPTASQPFPFEKDTNAYKRCLSRGLHQMVAVRGTDSEAFARAVTKAFGSLLRGRPWVPLQAQLCDAETLLGLPMLRPLEPSLVGAGNYDQDFLRQHCAVCGPNGKIDSLYIAMESDKFSWHSLRRSPCHKEDLEDSWFYDPLLDPNDPFEDDDGIDEDERPSAGDIVPPLPASLKRTASEMSRTPSFSAGSAGEGGSRPKAPRTACVPVPVELRRRVETV